MESSPSRIINVVTIDGFKSVIVLYPCMYNRGFSVMKRLFIGNIDINDWGQNAFFSISLYKKPKSLIKAVLPTSIHTR